MFRPKIFILILILSILQSCKNEKKNDQQREVPASTVLKSLEAPLRNRQHLSPFRKSDMQENTSAQPQQHHDISKPRKISVGGLGPKIADVARQIKRPTYGWELA